MRLLLAFLLIASFLAGGASADDDNQKKRKKDWTPRRGWTMRGPLRLAGTVDHWSNGQVWLKTKNNALVELPQSAFAYSVDPSVTFATVQPGSAVKLRIPRNTLRFIAKTPSGRHLYESYDGTWYFPEEFFQRPERKKKDRKS